MHTKLCRTLLPRILLFSFATTTLATFGAEDCKQIMTNKTQCECSSYIRITEESLPGHLIMCPANVKVPQIEVLILKGPYFVNVRIAYNDNDSNATYKLLPALAIGTVDRLYLAEYPFASGAIAHLFQQLGITKLEHLNITYSEQHWKFNITRVDLSGLNDLKTLSIAGMDLSNVPETIFVDLPNLTLFSLEVRNIKIAINTFVALKKLKYLNLNCENLQQLPAGIFRNQRKLEILKINKNQLHNISRDLFLGASSIRALDLSNNQIESLQHDVFALLTNLDEIDLRYNKLEELPRQLFADNKKLTKVNISHNLFKALPAALFANLKNLHLVDITCDTKTFFDDTHEHHVSGLLVERTLRINCDLSDIPGDLIANSTRFTRILLANNELVTLNATLFANQMDLHQLDLSHNRLQTLSDKLFRDTLFLVELHLSYNQLTEISREIFSGLFHLETLHLDNNRLVTISHYAFVNTRSLSWINMANNQINLSDSINNSIEELESPFRYLAKLQMLNLRNNTLAYIFNDWRHKLLELEKLELDYNLITTLRYNDLIYHTNSELSISLSHNHISQINFQHVTLQPDTPNTAISVQLNNNPLDCDCKLLPFVEYIRAKTPHTKLKLAVADLACEKPENMQDMNVLHVEPQALLCPIDFKNFEPPHCPHDCECWERTHDSMLLVNCSSKNLTQVPPLPRVQPLALKDIELHIENNSLTKLPTVSITNTGYADVTAIYAAGNKLYQIVPNNLPHNLTYLDLSRNKFKRLNLAVLSFLNQSTSLKKIALSANPWSCECENKPLMVYVTNSNNGNTTIIDIGNINCATPTNRKMTEYLINNDICHEEQFLIIALAVGIFIVCFSILLITTLYYKHQTKVKIWMYKYRLCSCLVNEVELDKHKIYDAFISYSHKDEQFIAEHLVPQLEEGPIRFKLCVHVRDFIVGACIPDQIVCAIDDSRRTIIVLSENFINSVWARMEFRLAHQAALNEGRARVIVIVYGKIGDIDALDQDLQAYLKMTTYVEWGDPWFWDKLRYAMPHATSKLNNLVQKPLGRNEEDDVEFNKIPLVQKSRECDV